MAVNAPDITYKHASDYSVSATLQTHAIQIATVAIAESDICEVTGDWYTIGSTMSEGVSGFQYIPAGWNSLSLSAYAFGDGSTVGDPNAGTLSYSVYVCDYFGGASLVCSGTGAIGSRLLSHNPATGTTAAPATSCDAFLGTADPNYSCMDTLVNTAVWKDDVNVMGAGGTDDAVSINFNAFGSHLICVKTTALAGVTAIVWIMKPNY